MALTYLVVFVGRRVLRWVPRVCVLRLQEAAGAYDAEAKRVFGDTHPVLNFPVSSTPRALSGLDRGELLLLQQLVSILCNSRYISLFAGEPVFFVHSAGNTRSLET